MKSKKAVKRKFKNVFLVSPSLRSKRFRSIGLFAGLEHFSPFKRAKIGASAKECEKGEGEGGKETPPLPFPLLPSVLRSSQFSRRQKAKNSSTYGNACYAGYVSPEDFSGPMSHLQKYEPLTLQKSCCLNVS